MTSHPRVFQSWTRGDMLLTKRCLTVTGSYLDKIGFE